MRIVMVPAAQVFIEVQPRHTITLGSDTTVCAEADNLYSYVRWRGTKCFRSLGRQ